MDATLFQPVCLFVDSDSWWHHPGESTNVCVASFLALTSLHLVQKCMLGNQVCKCVSCAYESLLEQWRLQCPPINPTVHVAVLNFAL